MSKDIAASLATLSKQVEKLRDKEGKAWHEIAGETGQSIGKCILAYEFATVPDDELVSFKQENAADLGKKVVKLRNQGMSWGRISARTNVGEQRLRTLFDDAGGNDRSATAKGDRIGKGGRYPGSNGSTPTKRVAKKAAAKKSPAKKAPATKKAAAKKQVAKKAPGAKKSRVSASPGGGTTTAAGKVQLVDMDLDGLNERLSGKTIKVTVNGRTQSIDVKSVRTLEDGVATLLAVGGNTRTVKVDTIRAAMNLKSKA